MPVRIDGVGRGVYVLADTILQMAEVFGQVSHGFGKVNHMLKVPLRWTRTLCQGHRRRQDQGSAPHPDDYACHASGEPHLPHTASRDKQSATQSGCSNRRACGFLFLLILQSLIGLIVSQKFFGGAIYQFYMVIFLNWQIIFHFIGIIIHSIAANI